MRRCGFRDGSELNYYGLDYLTQSLSFNQLLQSSNIANI